MKHVKKFEEFLQYKNPDSEPEREAEKGKAETTANQESPEKDSEKAADPLPEPEEKKAPAADQSSPKTDAVPTSEQPDKGPEEEKPSDTPATDKAEEVEDEDDDDDSIKEGNAFLFARKKAKDEGKETFDFNGKTYKVFEGKTVNSFNDYLMENFALYPGYNNMLGSEVMRNVPFTHMVNKAVYGRDYVIEQPTPVVAVAVEVKEGETPGYKCSNCGCHEAMEAIEQNPGKACSDCGGNKWEIVECD